MGNKRLVTVLLYRGSDDGWNHIDFHSRCDNKGPTISLFKVKNGDCIGGYTKEKWISENYYILDTDSILFNLSSHRHFPGKQNKNGISCDRGQGPCFRGHRVHELIAWHQPFNEERSCLSLANESGYEIPKEGEKNMLTN